jgi:hypothetical protein
MDNRSILDLFFNDVLPSIVRNDLKVDDFTYNIHFNVMLLHDGKIHFTENANTEGVPTLVIKDVEMFSNLLLEFIHEVIKHNTKWCPKHISSAPVEIKVKYFLALMWSNMTANDFLNTENYVRRCISFIKDDTFGDLSLLGNPLETLKGSRIEVSNIEDNTCHSTPYMMRMSIVNDDGYRFPLPDVNYAIETVNNVKRAYIFAVQNDTKFKVEDESHEKYCKKINYLLYKTDKDVPKEELEKKNLSQDTATWGDENIVVLSRSSLVSLTVALTLLDRAGVKEVLVPSYIPLHWDAKSTMYTRKLEHFKSQGYSKEQLETLKSELEEEQIRIQRNLTEKLIRNFRRLDYHFDGLNVTAYPEDMDDFMHLCLNNMEAQNHDHLLGEIADSISVYVDNKKSL